MLTNHHYMAKHQNNQVTFSWGARFLRLYDEFRVTMLGQHSARRASGIRRSRTQIVGPQVGVQWVEPAAAVDA